MTSILTDLELIEVSLVDDPANPGALVALHKRKDDINMTDENEVSALVAKVAELEVTSEGLQKSLTDAEQALDAKDEEKEEVSKSLAALMAALDALGFDALTDGTETRLEKRAAPEMIEVEGEMLLKSAIPAVILTKLEKQAEALAKAAEETAAEELRKQANAILPNMKGTADERGALLKAVGGDEVLLSILRSANAAMASVTAEDGAAADPEVLDPAAALEKMAKALRAEKPALSVQQAHAEVYRTPEGKRLLKLLNTKE